MNKSILAALALAVAASSAMAFSTPPPETPTPTTNVISNAVKSTVHQSQAAMAGAASKAAASSTSGASAAGGAGGSGTASVGDVAPAQNSSLSSSTEGSRSWSLFLPPLAYVPPMAPIQGCAAKVTQSARGFAWGAYSDSGSSADTDACTLIAIRNAKVESCQYASAKQIEDLLTAKMLPAYKPTEVKFEDLSPKDCAATKALPPAPPVPPSQPAVNYIAPPVVVPPAASAPVPVNVTCVAPAPAPAAKVKRPAVAKVDECGKKP